MRRGPCSVIVAAFLWACAAAMGAEAAPGGAAPQAGARDDAQTRQALEAVEKVLRGERVNDLDLKDLDNAVIRLETGGGGNGLDAVQARDDEDDSRRLVSGSGSIHPIARLGKRLPAENYWWLGPHGSDQERLHFL